MNAQPNHPSSSAQGDAPAPERFTRDDSDKIRAYISYASSLPVALPAVQVFVGYQHAGVAGLEPSEIGALFERVRQNARSWEPASDAIRQQTAALVRIAGKVVPSGEAVIRGIRSMPLCVKVLARVGSELSDMPALDLPDEPLSSADVQSKRLLADQLVRLQKIQRDQVDRSAEAMRLMAVFRDGVKALEPLVAGKRMAVRNSKLEQIDQDVTVEPVIAALQREYDRAVQTDGPQAEIALARRNELNAAIQTLKSQMDVYRARQRVTYSTGRLFVHFTELGVVMLDAEMALEHLWLAWREAAAALDNACLQFESIDSSGRLLTFLSEFQTVVQNWKLVQTRAAELNGIF